MPPKCVHIRNSYIKRARRDWIVRDPIAVCQFANNHCFCGFEMNNKFLKCEHDHLNRVNAHLVEATFKSRGRLEYRDTFTYNKWAVRVNKWPTPL